MIIHLIAAGKYQDQKNWPKIWVKCFESVKKLPYDINIWTDEGIDKLLQEDDKEFYDEYLNKLDIIYKIDYVRYVILEKYGGAYFDMDVELKVDFLSWLDPSKVYLAEGEINCLVNNHIMISPPEYILWNGIKQQLKYRLINNFDKAKTNPHWTMELIGPIGLSYILAKEKISYTPLSRYHFGREKSALRFCIHHATNSWTKNSIAPYKYFGITRFKPEIL